MINVSKRFFTVLLLLDALLVTGESFARESKEQKEQRSAVFWSFVVALNVTEIRLAEHDIASAKDWMERARAHFEKIRTRVRNEAEVLSELEGLRAQMNSPLEPIAEQILRDQLSTLRMSVFKGLDDLPIPTETPRLDVAEKVFIQHCMSCHGENGNGKGELTSSLRKPPQSFYDSRRVSFNAPISAYAAGVQGIETSEMPSYRGVLSPLELWSVSFYVAGLPYSDQVKVPCDVPMDMIQLALNSDLQLTQIISDNSTLIDRCKNSMAWLRWSLPFDASTKRSLEEFNTTRAAQKNIGIYWFAAATALFIVFFTWLLLSRRG